MIQHTPALAQAPELQRPDPPASLLNAVKVMYLGALVSVIHGVIYLVTESSEKAAGHPGSNRAPGQAAYHQIRGASAPLQWCRRRGAAATATAPARRHQWLGPDWWRRGCEFRIRPELGINRFPFSATPELGAVARQDVRHESWCGGSGVAR
jgi:hypothetical protein